jgi:predicted outer membrane repeat protein
MHNSNNIFVLLTLVLLTTFLSISSVSAINTENATYVSTEESISPDGSVNNPYNNLSDALDNTDPNGVIILDNGTYKGRGSNVGLSLSKNLTIVGANYLNSSKGETIFDGEYYLGRLFELPAGSGASVSFYGITFKGGNATNGIITAYGSLSIINCTFINNIRSARSSYGLLIYQMSHADSKYLIIINSTLKVEPAENNFTDNGGMIYAVSSEFVVIENSYFEGYSTRNNYADTRFTSPNTNISNSTFKNFETGIGVLTINNGIVRDCIFENNNASIGGVIYNSNIVFENCVFVNNSASDSGGAIYGNGVSMSIYNCIFENNTATNIGGAIFFSGGSLIISNSNFTNNYATIGAAIGRDGIYGINTGLTIFSIQNSVFRNHNLDADGVISLKTTYDNVLNVTGSVFENNGVAILFTSGSEANINYNRFYNNTLGVNTTVANVNADYNWWGNNTPTDIWEGVVPDNYFVVGLGTDKNSYLYDENISYSYYLSLNDSSVYEEGLLPLFLGTLTYNGETTEFSANLGNDGELSAVLGEEELLAVVDGQVLAVPFNVDKATPLIILDSVSGSVGDSVFLNATLLNGDKPVANKTVRFYVNGEFVGEALTDENGKASITYEIPTAGTLNLQATVESDENYYSSSNNNVLNSEKGDSYLSLETTAINESDVAVITATLKDINGNGIEGQEIKLIINNKAYFATTNSSGIAIFNIPNLPSGSLEIIAIFVGSNDYLLSLTNSSQIVIEKPVDNTTNSTNNNTNTGNNSNTTDNNNNKTNTPKPITKPKSPKFIYSYVSKKIGKYGIIRYTVRNIGDLIGSKIYKLAISKHIKLLKVKASYGKTSLSRNILSWRIPSLKIYKTKSNVVRLYLVYKRV